MKKVKSAVKENIIKQLKFDYSVMLGCDPEFFFTSNGAVVGSEKVLPKNGLTYDTEFGYFDDIKSGFIIDGVQAELNPSPNTCRAYLGNEIHTCFRNLYEKLKKDGKTVGVAFAPLVDISQAELDSLSEKSKVFGCAPSTNIYQGAEEAKITVNPKKYLKRSAGGHIHLGVNDDEDYGEVYAGYIQRRDAWGYTYSDQIKLKVKTVEKVLHDPKTVVPILDLVVANTCVLLDRDASNIERRKNYGRVGEYRQKKYGIEYRTLSNFWLRSYQLTSFVMGLCRMTVHMVQQSRKGCDYVKALTNAVSREDVIKAVQENNFELAYQNFRKIEHILVAACGKNSYDYPFKKSYMEAFHHFVAMGMDYWFKQDPMTHWIRLPDGHGRGWESFTRKIRKDKRDREKNGEVFNYNVVSTPKQKRNRTFVEAE